MVPAEMRNKNLSLLWPAALFMLLAGVVFRSFLGGSAVLMTTDAAISGSNRQLAEVLRATYANWSSDVLLGTPSGSATGIPSLLQGVTPGVLWNNLVYGLACLAASVVFLVGFVKFLNRWAVVCGALVAFWLGSNFTLLYAGHDFKPYVVLFFFCAILSASIASWRGGVLWGGFTGLMFAHQPDVALFFALFAGAHLIFRLWQREGLPSTSLRAGSLLRWLRVLIPAAIVAFLFAAGPLLSGYKLNVKDTAQVKSETRQEKWEYVTQWSFPPEESVDFVAPAYTGWRSGEPDGPYWGRMGRSTGWEHTRQGFMNFKMESMYLGFVPIAFMLFAIFTCRYSPHRLEILFWGAASVVALLLAFGKFFPLYSLFYQLPVVNNIRNPNKFLQIFQVAVGILTAYGVDSLFRSQGAGVRSQKAEGRGQRAEDRGQKAEVRRLKKEDGSQNAAVEQRSRAQVEEPNSARRFFWVVVAALGVLVLWALGTSLKQMDTAAGFSNQGWPAEAARAIAANQVRALWHAAFMAACTAAVFALFSFPRFEGILRFRNWLAAALALVISADAVVLSKHYVQPMPRSYIQANALTDFLKARLGVERVALLTQQGIYNVWLTYLLPYNRIPAFNFSQMPRMANDYKAFLTAGSKSPLRMWRFAAVKYLLGPTAVEKQLPAGQVRRVFTYDLVGTSDNEFQVVPAPSGAHAVFELLDTVPRYAAVTGFDEASDAQALDRMAGNGPLLNGQEQTGAVHVVRYRPGHVELKTQSDTPIMLRAAERWDLDWKATVEGQPTEVRRIDFLCQGVALPAGAHEVTLSYSPSRFFFYLQCSGAFVLLSAFFFRRSPRHENA